MNWEDKIYKVKSIISMWRRKIIGFEVIDDDELYPLNYMALDALDRKGFYFIGKTLYIRPRNLNKINQRGTTQSGKAYKFIKPIMMKKEKLDNYIKLI